MKIERREVKYHITLLNGDHLDVLMKQYVGVTNLVVVISREDSTWTIEGQHKFSDSAHTIPVLMEITKGSTADTWSIFDLIQASM